MKRQSAVVRRLIGEAVGIVDREVEYGAMGIDAPPEAGRLAADILRDAVARAPGESSVRYLYAAALSLEGRLDDAREQLGLILEDDRYHFESLAELDHPAAWRHVFLSPPWSERSAALPPLARAWVDPAGLATLASLREGADRIVSVVARVPPPLAAGRDVSKLPAVLDFTWRTRLAGPLIALHAGMGGPAEEDICVVDGFVFPWPEGEGHRQELLIGAFLRQDRTFVVLVDPKGNAVVNRLIRFGPDDLARARQYVGRLASILVHSTETGERIAAIARYREEFPESAIRTRLSFRLRAGHAPPDPEDAEPDTTEPECSWDTPPRVRARAPSPSPAPAAAEPPRESMAAPGGPSAAGDEADAQSALLIAGLGTLAPREGIFAHLIPVALGATAVAGGTVGLAFSHRPSAGILLAGATLGILVASLVLGIVRFALDAALGNHVHRLIIDSKGVVTPASLLRVLRSHGDDLLPGRAGARVRRRLLRVLSR